MNIQLNNKILSQRIKTHLDSVADFWNKYELLESPIEKIVFERLFKYKNENVDLIPQKTINTISGNFRPDIILKLGDNEIAIECDGKEFHKNEYYDEWRDAMILNTSNIQSIFRLRGTDIYTDLQDIIFFIAQKEPDFFNKDLIDRLKPSIRPEFIDRNENFDCVVKKRVVYDDFGKNGEPVKRMFEVNWLNIGKSFDRFCYREILIAYLNPGKSIEELIALKKEKEISTEKLYEMFFEKYPEYKDEK
jgi:very-short-patch-repair endonuclease